LALSNRHILTTADFVFRCPATGFNVQHELDDDQEFSEDEDEAITCLATERLESALRNFVGFAAVLADLDDLLGNDLRLTCAYRPVSASANGRCCRAGGRHDFNPHQSRACSHEGTGQWLHLVNRKTGKLLGQDDE
jgi:hypothetical protein